MTEEPITKKQYDDLINKREECRSGNDRMCGLCSGSLGQKCWYDLCKHCDEIRIEHRYGIMGCGRNLEQFERRNGL